MTPERDLEAIRARRNRMELGDAIERQTWEKMTRSMLLAVTALLLLSACTVSTPSGPDLSPGTCVDPPASETGLTSPTDLSVEPNPVAAGSDAMLTIGDDGVPEDAIVGAGASWQCWNGSVWMATHQIVRGFNDDAGQTIEVAPGVTTTIPGIGLPVPSSYPIVIPDVAPGVYRITDDMFEDGAVIRGFVFVDVVRFRP